MHGHFESVSVHICCIFSSLLIIRFGFLQSLPAIMIHKTTRRAFSSKDSSKIYDQGPVSQSTVRCIQHVWRNDLHTRATRREHRRHRRSSVAVARCGAARRCAAVEPCARGPARQHHPLPTPCVRVRVPSGVRGERAAWDRMEARSMRVCAASMAVR